MDFSKYLFPWQYFDIDSALSFKRYFSRIFLTVPFKNILLFIDFDVKACVRYFQQIFIASPNDSPSKTIRNAFYFI